MACNDSQPMPYSLNDQEFAAVLALPAGKRYAHFIKRAADWEEVWTLKTADVYVLAGDEDGHEYLPVWPHPRYAQACARDGWEDAEPALIVLEAWIERWLPGMLADGKRVAVFPTPTGKGVGVTPDRLVDDLTEEAARYE